MRVYDFQPNSEMSPTIGLLHGMVTYNFERVARLVQGLTQKQLDYKGPGSNRNSIAQLLRHLAVVDLHWVYRLQSKDIPNEQKEQFGPMYDSLGKLPMVENLSLETMLEQYRQIQNLLTEVCKGLTDDKLEDLVPFENGNSATVRWGIWHIADHSRHHYANIAHLKKYNTELK